MLEDYPFDLRHAHQRRITTSHPGCQEWFARGLTWLYSFNPGEAKLCFAKALDFDSRCAMAYWGMAYSTGPNFNKPWRLFDIEDMEKALVQARRDMNQALRFAEPASAGDQALINALAARFAGDGETIDWTSSDRSYVEAMRIAKDENPEDLDLLAMFGEAILTMVPKTVWTSADRNDEAYALAQELESTLQKGFLIDGARDHIGLNHMYIHLMERSPYPERAKQAADQLRDPVKDAGHLQHMPAHIDISLGHYDLAITANTRAVRADKKFADTGLNVSPMFSFYRAHDYHSLIYAAMLAGRYEVALSATEELERALPEKILRVESPPMADWLETFHGVRVHVLIRFGKWREILDLAAPTDTDLYRVTTATLFYGRGVAHAAMGNIDEALVARDEFLTALEHVPSSRMDYPNRCTDIFEIARAMLDGELQYRRGSYESAFSMLEKAIVLDDALDYSEPWAWMLPARHPYAALKLEQGHVAEALMTYEVDLGISKLADPGQHRRRHPKNIWALAGYVDCLKKLDRTEDLAIAESWLTTASIDSDIGIVASCYCKRGAISLEPSQSES